MPPALQPLRGTLGRTAAWLVLALISCTVACGPHGSKRYEATGIVREVQPLLKQVVIAHDDIPGLMPPMTMSFDVPDVSLLERLSPGDRIRFVLERTDHGYRILDAEVVGRATESSAAGPTFAGSIAEREPAPEFQLTNQDGRTVSLSDFRGRTILLDFIFTNCTGPCPVLTGLHRDVQRLLAADEHDAVQLVSISLDPERDSPAVLRAYAGDHEADLSNWSFLTGTPATVEAVLRSYGVGVLRKAGEGPAHLVITFVIDGHGSIAKRIVGLEASAEERANTVRAVSGQR